jgi:hypothetical protein
MHVKSELATMGPDFELVVKDCFAFLEAECSMTFRGVREVNADDPRERGLVVRYRSSDLRVDIGWSEGEGSLAVLIRLEREDLPRPDRYVYLEPFVEFFTKGSSTAIVPQVYLGMSESKIQTVMSHREGLFKGGLAGVLKAVADKLHNHLDDIRTASAADIRCYHEWMRSRGRADS